VSADSARSAAEQARKANELADHSVRLDERAWVEMIAFRISNEPIVNQPVTVTTFFINHGKSPAELVVDRSSASLGSIEPRPPNWNVRKPSTPFILFPNITGPLQVTRTFTSEPLTPTANEVSLYQQGHLRMYFYAIMTYDDIFGGHHWIQSCMYHRFYTTQTDLTLSSFVACNVGQDTDQN
jgi:hypothetical protein